MRSWRRTYHDHAKSSPVTSTRAQEGLAGPPAPEGRPEVKRHELVERGLDLGLEAAPSINDRNISLFSRGLDPMFARINTFLKSPYVENIRDIGRYDVAVVGAPFDRARPTEAVRASTKRPTWS